MTPKNKKDKILEVVANSSCELGLKFSKIVQ